MTAPGCNPDIVQSEECDPVLETESVLPGKRDNLRNFWKQKLWLHLPEIQNRRAARHQRGFCMSGEMVIFARKQCAGFRKNVISVMQNKTAEFIFA